MKIIADENIPFLQHYFGRYGDIVLKPGRLIVRDDVEDADMLLVRSTTQVTQELVKGTSLKFIGSTTTGKDHINTNYLDQVGIFWATAEGCNANAVVEYVLSSFKLFPNIKRAAVIGVGRIGKKVAERMPCEVFLCDPFRAECAAQLGEIQDVDFVTLHVPLTRNGPHPTFHMIGKNFLARQKAGCVILNSSRGSVISFEDLKKYGKHLTWCLDVWENEPDIDLEILKNAFIATPHIAGYSIQSKLRGIEMIYEAAVKANIIPDEKIQAPVIVKPRTATELDLLQTSQQMKEALLSNAETFDELRKKFERWEL